MGDSLKTEPGYPVKKSWSAKNVGIALGTALSVIGGAAAVLAGMGGGKAEASQPRMTVAGMALQRDEDQKTASRLSEADSARLSGIENALRDLQQAQKEDREKVLDRISGVTDRLSRIEGRLERR